MATEQELGRLVIKIIGDISELRKQFNDAKGALKDFGENAKTNVNNVQSGFKGLEAGAGKIVSALSLLKSSAIVYLGEQVLHAAERVFNFAKSIAESAHQIEKQSEILGISVKDYQKLDYAAKMSGVSSDSLSLALRTLARNMGEAQQGVGRAKPYFEALGITMADLKSKSPVDVLLLLADRFKGTEDGARKMEYASNLLATRYGDNVIPMLNKGSAGIKAFGDEAVQMGTVLGDVVVKKGSEAENTFIRLGAESNALKLSFAPVALGIANFFEAIVSGIKSVKDTWDGLPAPLRGLLFPTTEGEKSFMTWWMGLGQKIGIVPTLPSEIGLIPSHGPGGSGKPAGTTPPLPPVLTDEQRAFLAQQAMERLKIEEDAATALENLSKEENATLQTLNEQAYRDGLTSEEDYLEKKHKLEEDNYRKDIDLANKQISIMTKAYSEVVGVAPEKERAKLRLQVDLEIQKAREKLLETTEKLNQVETKGTMETAEQQRTVTLAVESARIKALEEEAKKQNEINQLRVQAGEMPSLQATIEELDISKRLNQEKVKQLELEKSLTPETAKKKDLDGQISVLNKEIEDTEKRRLKVQQDLRDTILAQASAHVSILEAQFNAQKEINALKVGLGFMRPEEATKYELDAQRALNEELVKEQRTKLQFATTDAERVKIYADISNLELQIEDSEKRQLVLMESRALQTGNIPQLMEIGVNKAAIQSNQDLINQYENLLPNAVNVFTDAIRNTDGTFKGFVKSMEEGFLKIIQEIALTIAKMQILKALGQGGGAGGVGLLSGLWKWITGSGSATTTGYFSPETGLPVYAEGGTFVATKPTQIVVGEGRRPELVSIIPFSGVPESIFGPPGGMPRLRPFQNFAGGGTILFNQGGGSPTQRQYIGLDISLDPSLIAKSRHTPDEIDLIISSKYKAGGKIYKAIKER